MSEHPTDEEIERVSQAALKALEGMVGHALYTLACTVVHDVAVKLEQTEGRGFSSTVVSIGLSVMRHGKHPDATADRQGKPE